MFLFLSTEHFFCSIVKFIIILSSSLMLWNITKKALSVLDSKYYAI